MKRILTIAFICGWAHFAFSQNFGIDEPSPQEKLDINGNLRVSTGIINSNGDHMEIMRGVRADDNSYEWIGFYSGTARQGIILYDGAWSGANSLTNEFSFTAENNNLLTLNTTNNHIGLMPKGGNVGVGTTSPSQKLDVAGTVKANAFQFADGSTQTSAAKVVASYFAITPATRQTVTSITPTLVSGLSITLTPKSANSKFLIMATINGTMEYVCSSLIYRNSSPVLSHGGNTNEPGANVTTYGWSQSDRMAQHIINYLDDPNTASPITYDIRITSGWAGSANTLYVNDRSSNDMRTPSTLTILEFAE